MTKIAFAILRMVYKKKHNLSVKALCFRLKVGLTSVMLLTMETFYAANEENKSLSAKDYPTFSRNAHLHKSIAVLYKTIKMFYSRSHQCVNAALLCLVFKRKNTH